MNLSLRSQATRLTALVSLLTLSLALFQCGKKSDDPAPAPTAADVAGTWKMTAIKISPALNGVTDYFQAFAALYGQCFADVKYTFNASGTMLVAAPQGCTVDEGDITDQTGVGDQSKWSVSDGKIIITDSAGSDTYDLNVNNNTMEWSSTEKDPTDNKTYTLTIVFTKA